MFKKLRHTSRSNKDDDRAITQHIILARELATPMSSSSSSEILTAEPLGGGEFKAQQPAPTTIANDTDELGLAGQQPKTHALFTMLDYTLTPVALAVLISLILVSVACLALMALAVKRTLWDNKSKHGATDMNNNAKRRRHRHKGSGSSAVIYDISDGSRRSGDGPGRASGNGVSGTSGMSCLVALLVVASFIGIAVGMVFAIDRTVVALC